MSTTSFGAYIKCRRYALGWNRTELARKAEISRAQVRLIEEGICKPKAPTFARVVDALGLDRDEAANVLES
jgi:transcriptional regulator with XRE-family HTH domain